MLNPRVGEMEEISSPTSRLRMVVLPALSSPLAVSAYLYSLAQESEIVVRGGGMTDRKRTLISFDLALFFRMIVSSPTRHQLLFYLGYCDSAPTHR